MSRPRRHAALTRNDEGGLDVRTFPTAGDATAAATVSGRDFVVTAKDWAPGALGSPADLARRLNGTPSRKTIARLCAAGDLPCRDDGGGSLPRWRLPIRAVLASICNGGLRLTVARHRSGFFGQF